MFGAFYKFSLLTKLGLISLISSINLLSSQSSFIQPNSSSFLYGGKPYNVVWNTSDNVNLQFQINDNEQWVSHINNSHFLSITIDQTVNNYNWSVPVYLTQYWENPVRMILNSLDTQTTIVSDEFNIAGISVNTSFNNVNSGSQNIAFYNDNISISWDTNVNDSVFNVSLYDNGTTYNNIMFRVPLQTICNNISLDECVWDAANITGSFVFGVTNQNLYGLSDNFYIYHTPTPAPTYTPTALPTGSPTSSPSASPTPSPSFAPTSCPTQNPTSSPTLFPTSTPTSDSPTSLPITAAPTTTAPTATLNTHDKNNDKIDNTFFILIIVMSCLVCILISIYFIYKYKDVTEVNPAQPANLQRIPNAVQEGNRRAFDNLTYYSNDHVASRNFINNTYEREITSPFYSTLSISNMINPQQPPRTTMYNRSTRHSVHDE